MAEYIQRQDSLNTGREKINAELTKANENASSAGSTSNQANNTANNALSVANQANNKSDDTQQQLDDIILDDGTGNAEVIQARGGEPLLKDRLNKTDAQLADTDYYRSKESMINRKKRRPMIWWVDDDGRKGVYTKLKPLSEEYGIPFTSALISKHLDNPHSNFLTVEEIRELQEDYGFEFLSHTHNHDSNNRPNDMTDAELHEDFSNSVKALKKYGLNYRGVVLPFGEQGSGSERVRNIARQYFDFAVGTGASGPTEDNSGPVQLPPIDMYYIRRTTVERGFDIIKRQIDAARDNDGLVVVVSHVDNSGSHDWWDEAYVRQVIEYALSQGLEFVTSKEALAAHGNIAQFGNTKITPDGTVYSDILGKVRYIGTKTLASDPIDVFEKDVVSISTIPAANAEGFLDGRGGILKTYRFSDSEHYSYQLFTSSRNIVQGIRFWKYFDGDEWSEWHTINNTRYLGLNAMTPTTPPQKNIYDRGIFLTYITNDGKDGFPENKPGLLKTYAMSAGDRHTQDYRLYRSDRVYSRYWTGLSWSDWTISQDTVAAFTTGTNEVLSSTPASAFEVGITNSYVNAAANDSGFPTTTGNLLTYKYEGGIGRTFQEWRPYAESNKFIRHEQLNGYWSNWERFVLESV